MKSKDYIGFISKKNPECIWITELWRVDYGKFIARIIKELKASLPTSKIIVDTIDFHYKEFIRKFELKKKPADLEIANEFLEIEKFLYLNADTVVVISKDEKKDIQNHVANIKKIEIIPNIHKPLEVIRPFIKRNNICFVGNFGNPHNVDAVKYFLRDIFPLILKEKSDIEFHVLGYLAQKYRTEFSHPNVKIIGSISQLIKALTYYKLFVCPMIYGAGMKGKIGDAISAGTPVVTTSIGAEGFPVKDGSELFIADSPFEFAKKCGLCLSDPVVWSNISNRAMSMMREHFSPAIVARQLKIILSN
jgi:glycosyltransferase involved in cell wall biosynthesis